MRENKYKQIQTSKQIHPHQYKYIGVTLLANSFHKLFYYSDKNTRSYWESNPGCGNQNPEWWPLHYKTRNILSPLPRLILWNTQSLLFNSKLVTLLRGLFLLNNKSIIFQYVLLIIGHYFQHVLLIIGICSSISRVLFLSGTNTQSQLLLRVGFEPTHLTILDLKSSALDHSAIWA